ncbi:MAG: hypothetical protein AAF799_24255 [Myxococcota bacterium]
MNATAPKVVRHGLVGVCGSLVLAMGCGPTITPQTSGAGSGSGSGADSSGAGVEETGADSTSGADDSSGEMGLVPCFARLSTLSATTMIALNVDDDGYADLLTGSFGVGFGNAVDIQLNRGDSWTILGSLGGGEFARFVPFDEDLDGFSDIAFYDPPAEPALLRNVGASFADPEPLAEPWIDALWVDLNADGTNDVVRFVDEVQISTYQREADGTPTPLTTTEFEPPDAGMDPVCPPWSLIGGTASFNTPHAVRRYSRCCERRCEYESQIFAIEDGVPSLVATYDGPAARWLGDFEGDGQLELITPEGLVDNVVDGGLVQRMNLETSDWAVGDLEPDGLLDLVVNTHPGSGTDDPPMSAVRFGADEWMISYELEGRRPGPIADYDGDGDRDLILEGWEPGNPVVIEFDQCPP